MAIGEMREGDSIFEFVVENDVVEGLTFEIGCMDCVDWSVGIEILVAFVGIYRVDHFCDGNSVKLIGMEHFYWKP